MAHATGAGDYDYDDSHDLSAGCQYLDMQSSDTADPSSTPNSAQPPGLAGADGGRGPVSAPASAPGSAVAATTAPVQAPAPSAYMETDTSSISTPSYSARAPASGMALGNAASAYSARAAGLSGVSAERPGQGNLLCRPIAAKRDSPSGMSSRSTKAFIAIGVVIPVCALFVLMLCCYSSVR